jgi:hypothetical protein
MEAVRALVARCLTGAVNWTGYQIYVGKQRNVKSISLMHTGTRSTNLQPTCPAKAFNFYSDGRSTTTHIGTLRGLCDPAEDGTNYLRNIGNHIPVKTA